MQSNNIIVIVRMHPRCMALIPIRAPAGTVGTVPFTSSHASCSPGESELNPRTKRTYSVFNSMCMSHCVIEYDWLPMLSMQTQTNREHKLIFGFDFSVPQGLEDVSTYPTLFAELMATGKWTVDDLRKLAGLNFLRVMQEVEKVRDEFKKANVPPYEDVMLPRPKENNCTSADSLK